MTKDMLAKKDNSFILVSIIVVVVIIALWLLTYYCLKDLSETARSSYGEMFGGINSLFSGLALAGIILTILLQKKELSLQRQELIETREELKRTADAQEKSEMALNRQAENLKISAKLSALNSLINYYFSEEERFNNINTAHPSIEISRLKKEKYAAEIEEILDRKEYE